MKVISEDIRRGQRKQGTELTADDVGRPLDVLNEFGVVLVQDVGRRVWLKDYGLVMESIEQRDKRKNK